MNELVHFDRARQELALAKDIDEIKQIRDKAEALRHYIRQQGASLEMQNQCAEIKIRAERRAGEMLAEMEKNPGTKGQLIGPGIIGGNTMQPPTIPKLEDLGISKMQSHRWQIEADVPEPEFEHHIAEVKSRGEELTSKGLLDLAYQRRRIQEKQGVVDVAPPIGKYSTIVVDPPWPMGKSDRTARPLQGPYLEYPTMEIEEIKSLPVSDLAAESCHVYLWATHRFLPVAFEVFETWGVKYHCLLTWVKNVGFTPFSWMFSTEHCLFGWIGNFQFEKMGLRVDFKAPVREHSRKPDEFYSLVRAASPEPRIDLFSRERHEGFDAWGAEAGKFKEKG